MAGQAAPEVFDLHTDIQAGISIQARVKVKTLNKTALHSADVASS